MKPAATAPPVPVPPVAAKPGEAKPAAKPATAKKKGMGAGAMIAIGAVVVALGAGAVFMLSSGGSSDDLAADAAGAVADPALDTPPIEDAPQPLPPELLEENLAPAAPVDPAADAAALPQIYRIVTRPVGAAITVDGKLLDGVVTPAEVELPHDAKHLIADRARGSQAGALDVPGRSPERGSAAHAHAVLPAAGGRGGGRAPHRRPSRRRRRPRLRRRS